MSEYFSMESMGIKKYTAKELLNKQFEEPEWVIPGILPEGLCILAGRPKVGKSWLALQIALEVSTGGFIFDKQVAYGKILYIALEDSERRMQKRIRMLGNFRNDNITFCFDWEPLTESGVILLEEEIIYNDYQLVIIDTVGRLTPDVKNNDYGENVAIYSELQKLAMKHSITILGLDHHRKSNNQTRDIISDVIGSTGKSGTADSVWGLYKHGKGRASLQVAGRDFGEEEIDLQFDPETGSWEISEHTLPDQQKNILDFIDKNLLGEFTPTEVSKGLGIDRGTIGKQLFLLENKGEVVKTGSKWKRINTVPPIPPAD